jgi:hypothetical protein
VRDFIIKYKDRLIYATDAGLSQNGNPENAASGLHNTWLSDWKYFVSADTLTSTQVNGEFQGLQLPRDIIDHIYYKNAIHWFGIGGRKNLKSK